MRTILSVVIVFVFFSFSLNAQEVIWEIDKAHSSINFSISHMVISDVTGNFTSFDGKVVAVSEDFADTKVNIVIKTASINTENEDRDKHLRNADFFDAEKYPDITFTTSSFKKVDDKKYKISGTLSMHGIEKEIVFNATFKGIIKDPWGNTRAGFKAKTVINRYDFDIVYNSTLETGGLLIGKEVDVEVNMELIKKN